MRRTLAALAAAALLAVPAAAPARRPIPSRRTPARSRPSPRARSRRYTVCKQKSVQVPHDPGRGQRGQGRRQDQGQVNGTYSESVTINGAQEALPADRRQPQEAGQGRPRRPGQEERQNGVFVNGADEVTVDGFTARDYKANGFFVVNVVGYKLTNLVAEQTGVYGVYAFNSKGGEMSHSEAYYNNDAGFYIGQTPQQTKPIRSIVRDVDSWGNPIGWSGTNMRYVTITKSRFYNNATGIVPNALDSEKFPPAEDNVITDNDIFWNNFNFHEGAPFKIREDGVGRAGAGRHRRPAARRPPQPHREQPDLRQLPRRRRRGARASCSTRPGEPGGAGARGQPVQRQHVRARRHRPQRPRPGLRRQRRGNCWGPNTGVQVTLPGRPGVLPGVPVRRRERVQLRTRRASSSASWPARRP